MLPAMRGIKPLGEAGRGRPGIPSASGAITIAFSDNQ
jgi:hypothetical protein